MRFGVQKGKFFDLKLGTHLCIYMFIPFFDILQISEGRILDTRGNHELKSHLRSTTKSPSFFKDSIISDFRLFILSRDCCFNLRSNEAIVCLLP